MRVIFLLFIVLSPWHALGKSEQTLTGTFTLTRALELRVCQAPASHPQRGIPSPALPTAARIYVQASCWHPEGCAGIISSMGCASASCLVAAIPLFCRILGRSYLAGTCLSWYHRCWKGTEHHMLSARWYYSVLSNNWGMAVFGEMRKQRAQCPWPSGLGGEYSSALLWGWVSWKEQRKQRRGGGNQFPGVSVQGAVKSIRGLCVTTLIWRDKTLNFGVMCLQNKKNVAAFCKSASIASWNLPKMLLFGFAIIIFC